MNAFQRNAKALVIVATLASSVSSIFVRLAGEMPSMAVGFYRLSFAMPFLLAPLFLWFRKDLAALTRRQWGAVFLTGFFLFLHFITWFMSITRTTIASAVVLCSLHPIVVLVLSALFLKEKTTGKVVLGVVLALTGGAVVAGGDYSFAREALLGDLLAFLGAVFLALYFLAGQRLRPGIPAAVYITLVYAACWLFFLAGMLATGTPFTGYPPQSYAATVAMAFINQILSHGLINWSLGYVTPLYVATTQTGEVVFASILAMLLFSEIPTFWQIVGGGITILGILLYNYFESKALPTVASSSSR